MKILIIFIAFSSCNNSNPIDESTVFRYNEHKNINSLDPIFAKDIANIQAVNQLFNGLVEMDNNLNVIPSIAKSWEISENGKRYTFNIDTTVNHILQLVFDKTKLSIFLLYSSIQTFFKNISVKLTKVLGKWEK